jgi:hypothetical protein
MPCRRYESYNRLTDSACIKCSSSPTSKHLDHVIVCSVVDLALVVIRPSGGGLSLGDGSQDEELSVDTRHIFSATVRPVIDRDQNGQSFFV